MATITFRNKMNGEQFVCDNTKAVQVIDGIEYLVVHREINNRPVMMRKDMLEKINQSTTPKKIVSHK